MRSVICASGFWRFLVIDGYHLHFLLPGHVLHVILSLEAGVNGAVSGGEGVHKARDVIAMMGIGCEEG